MPGKIREQPPATNPIGVFVPGDEDLGDVSLEVGAAGGLASLDGDGKVPAGQLPAPSAPVEFVVEDYAGTARALAAGDDKKLIRCTAATAVTITFPAGIPADWQCDVLQAGAGQVTIAAGAGATVNAADAKNKTRVQYSVIGIARVAASTGVVYGDRA